MKEKLDAPFVYFGGKARIADKVWAALGEPKHYVEPFFGSGAVLLSRSNYNPQKHIETINDKDGFVANAWRSMQFSPDETARWCDWPVNHADLTARIKELLKNEERLLENLTNDPRWHDPIIAGYWIWCAGCGIGYWQKYLNTIPHIDSSGQGVHKIGGRPHIGDGGIAVHKIKDRSQIENRSHASQNVQGVYNHNIYTWFRRLSERLRYVRVVCGDWSRVCGGDWQDRLGICGIYFDPPYDVADRDDRIFRQDKIGISKDVLKWCAERGKKEKYRIVISGYEEYQELIDKYGWRQESWKTVGGYGNISRGRGKEQGKKNRYREKLYFSPYCVESQLKLF